MERRHLKDTRLANAATLAASLAILEVRKLVLLQLMNNAIFVLAFKVGVFHHRAEIRKHGVPFYWKFLFPILSRTAALLQPFPKESDRGARHFCCEHPMQGRVIVNPRNRMSWAKGPSSGKANCVSILAPP
ncbi:MAG: hypothetical protein JWO71_2580 [Candidatus Acidoferrum typicum]|nr:hypothetical protein [Candidatus Acidoferrum typicum]